MSKDAKGVLECLVSGHLVEGLFEFDADFLVLFLPVVEFLDQGVQLLLQLSSFTLSSGCLDLSKLQVQRQISAKEERRKVKGESAGKGKGV